MEKIIHKSELESVAHQFAQYASTVAVFALQGPLGAGKTTITQAILRNLGVTGPISSPTYTYVSVYHLANGKTVYHFDLYRITSVDQFIEAGFDEYLYRPDSWCFIEWPEVILPLLKERVLLIQLQYGATEDTRIMTVVPHL